MGFSKLRLPSFSQLVRHLFLAWLIATFTEYLLVPADVKTMEGIHCIAAMSFPRLLLITCLTAAVLWLVSCFFDIAPYERYAMAGMFFLLMTVTLFYNRSLPLLIISLIVLAALTVYGIWGHQSSDFGPSSPEKSHWAFPLILAVMAAVLFLVLCIWGICRYRSFSTPTFDFGIFSQMFHSMRTTGLPMTTVERDGLLSHFAVHVSPIYYLMLPFYCLFPDPSTLQVLQAMVICSAVIPLWLIGKHHGLSGLQRLLVCALLLVLPVTSGGVYYDLHENCFLLPLILWLMYAMDKRNSLLIGIFAFLTLMVKEDAAVYVAIAALYLILRTALNYRREYRKDLITGIVVLLVSVVYFLLVTNYLATQGDGVMTYRYRNFMIDRSDSLFSVIIAVLLCPMKMLFECVDLEKQTYILQALVPLLGLPLITRKFERYLLLIPYILLNLMSDYPYQHDILFQYNFGSAAFLIYLTAINLSDFRIPLARLIPSAAAIVTAVCFLFGAVVPEIEEDVKNARTYSAYYHSVQENLDLIPDNVSVAASTFYVAYLSQRAELYDIKYSPMETISRMDYIAVNKNYTSEFETHGSYEEFDLALKNAGYQIINDHSSVVIYHKTAS